MSPGLRAGLVFVGGLLIGVLGALALGGTGNGGDGAKLVSVFKVDRDIPAMLAGEQVVAEGYIVEAEIPREFLPANSVRSLDRLNGLVATHDVAANQVLVETMFADLRSQWAADERVAVFKIDRDIPQGMSGDDAIAQGYIVESQIPREFLPATSIRNLERLVGLVAVNDLSANQVLVDGMFVAP